MNNSLQQNQYYHIYNRGNNGQNIFYKEENYRYFLQQYAFYMEEYLETFAYCLLPNHFHMLVKVKNQQSDGIPARDAIASTAVSQQFRKFFISYSQAINKQQSRHGSLFEKPFKRKHVATDEYFKTLVYYIHNNPIHHGFVADIQDWQWTSYHSILLDNKTRLQKQKVLEWFDGKNNFTSFHCDPVGLQNIMELTFE